MESSNQNDPNPQVPTNQAQPEPQQPTELSQTEQSLPPHSENTQQTGEQEQVAEDTSVPDARTMVTTNIPAPKIPKKLLFFLVLAVLILLLIVFIALFIKGRESQDTIGTLPTADETSKNNVYEQLNDKVATADWKQYSNSKFGYELKYPDTWKSSVCKNETALLLDPDNVPTCETEPYGPIVVVVDQTEKDINNKLKQWLPHFKFEMKDEGTLPITYYEYSVLKIMEFPGPDNFSVIYIPQEIGFIMIYVYNPEYKEVADQILSSFKTS